MADVRLGWPGWVGVVVEDLEAARRFYRDVLGLRELDTTEEWVEFDLGEGRILELLRLDPQTPQYAELGYRVGFVVEDIRAAAEELEARGVERISGIEGGAGSSQFWCYFRDGAGNIFEIIERLPSEGG
jgi:catechol 2,3-dioxygenase-like lactoylglutathione lyase family enzyme